LTPAARGPISDLLRSWLLRDQEPDLTTAHLVCAVPCLDPIQDEDQQLALWMLYELHYGGFRDVDDSWEWSPACIELRGLLESPFEAALLELARPVTQGFLAHEKGLVEGFFDVVAATDGPSVTAFLQHTATREQMLEFLVHRTVYQLKEADPHAFAVPRLTGTAKARLLEILFDEYGGGRPDRLHATMFAQTLVACGLDPRYGAYLDRVPAVVLAVNNAMSLFGLHRRLRGAAMGHLAAFEATSSIPARRISRGLRRLGFPEVAAAYFDEHVEADAVHEQLAVRGVAGSLLRQDPQLAADVAFGAAASLCLDGLAASYLLERWQRGESGLRSASPVPTLQA
jgi:pyrroloquinoline quinone (PQQ) biosynthesis protein C